MFDGLSCELEFAQVVPEHLRFHFNTLEALAVVDSECEPDERRENRHIPEMCSKWVVRSLFGVGFVGVIHQFLLFN